MDNIERRAHRLYQAFGQRAVEDYGKSLRLDFAWCEPCENSEPIYDGACLVCGTSQEKYENRSSVT